MPSAAPGPGRLNQTQRRATRQGVALTGTGAVGLPVAGLLAVVAGDSRAMWDLLDRGRGPPIDWVVREGEERA